ncbi:hypothetical protein DY000_02022271 [Brassica cretica]|uniref:Uncharacterized protein n=1 Tax=Brassica cretica TaxID=69181 RepID=A0ABQ7E1U5_BRACR|nr:hypothetical protein DY000_02022271 [Brassica cretica]
MRMRITLKKKSDPGQFAISCTVKGIEFPHALCDPRASVSILPGVMADHLGLQVEPLQELFTFVDCSQKNSGGVVRDLEVHIGNTLVPVDFHVFDIKLNWNSSLLLGRAFLSIVRAVCKLQTNQLCLTLIDPNAHYDLSQSRSHKRSPEESMIQESFAHRKSTAIEGDKSVDTYPDEWENDYYNPTIAAYTRQNMHTDEYDEDYEEERATEYSVGVENGYDKVYVQTSAKTNLSQGNGNVSKPATNKFECDDRNTDKPSSVTTQRPNMHTAQSLSSVTT